MVCEQLDSFLSQEERAREEARGRKQEGTPSVSEEGQEKLGNLQEREIQRLPQEVPEPNKQPKRSQSLYS